MQTFSKTLSAVLSFILMVGVFSGILISIAFHSESKWYYDVHYRNELAGTLECLFIGSSRGLCGFNVKLINERLGITSYNLCGSAMSPNGKLAMLEEEIHRNPVKKVIIDVGDDDLAFINNDAKSEGEMLVIPRLQGGAKRFKYLINNVPFEGYCYLFARYLNDGFSVMSDYISGSKGSAIYRDRYGGIEKSTFQDVSLRNDELGLVFQSKRIEEPTETGIEGLTKLINCSISSGAEVILVSLPVAESKIWTHSGYDQVHSEYVKIAKQYNLQFWDFNLLKSRKDFFSDKVSFSDSIHLYVTGADVFSSLFCETLVKYSFGTNISDLFYSSYAEAMEHLDYMAILKSQTGDEMA